MFSARLAVVLFAVTTSAATKCAPDDDAALDTCTVALEEAQAQLEQCGPGDLTRREGGRVTSDDRDAVLSVPPGALPVDAAATIKTVESTEVDPPRTSQIVEIALFDAAGDEITQLEEPVTLCLKADTSKGGDSCLGYYDAEKKTWECQDECLKENGDLLCGKTDHFTSFAILLGGGKGSCDAHDDHLLTRRKGGVVASDDDLAFVSVPPAALEADTMMSVIPSAPPEADVPRLTEVYSFGPDGIKFTAPATVCIDAANADSKSGCLGYIDERVDPPKWVCEDPCVKHNGNTLCGTTDHFTSFAILLNGGLPDADCAKR
jgi:hypothetical protein